MGGKGVVAMEGILTGVISLALGLVISRTAG